MRLVPSCAAHANQYRHAGIKYFNFFSKNQENLINNRKILKMYKFDNLIVQLIIEIFNFSQG